MRVANTTGGVKFRFRVVSRPSAGWHDPKMYPGWSRTLPKASRTPWEANSPDFLAQMPVLILSSTIFAQKALTTFRVTHLHYPQSLDCILTPLDQPLVSLLSTSEICHLQTCAPPLVVRPVLNRTSHAVEISENCLTGF